ncbi:MAG: DUF255 domain-containing protein [Candidatus Marinimicrobia bacterium]|jgi:thiol:disulfide interchange protein DsbD|nr:DUF255 domain-containing protein [Candidatus Neomarinimicrobiota bacterium]MBT3634058.1 DUF255 domain-containing protein [Candidatus Neomarinimicrobiota bacterium]MBT3683068.1 DUF255 domain-containing protein [Candidatus Neomarinimicrobiota bacterium]MBT3759840.1 DUF255 domain-containing protein [Candidatus Neomarinimicrobiota bacterium]MBT3895707.1 DUF255 domain-containing protein [Candidatus Neomarinimicrobiota bacterium]
MKINNFLTLILLTISFSQNAFLDDLNTVSFDASVQPNNIRAGESIQLKLDVSIERKFHIYSVHPDLSLSPTNIEYADSNFFSVVGIINEPTPKTSYDENFDMVIAYLDGNFELTQGLVINQELEPGEYEIEAVFSYLACDETKCIPHWDDFSFPISIESGESREDHTLIPTSEYTVATYLEVDDSATDMGSLDEAINEGLFSFLLLAFSMGLLALLTPCVFPMIPITVSYFTKQGEDDGSSPVRDAGIYALGIIVIFTGLGLILAFTLGATGANQLASSPWMNIFIASLFVIFAFSLFGHFELQLPASLRQFSLNQESKGGVLGILFMAFTFTITSFTCTVQFVGLLLVAASNGSILWPVIGMLAFATTFAMPFFFLALFPQYLARLPKSGGWLNSVKVIMGFLELGAAMKFISNVDLVWQWGIFTNQVVLAVWVVLSFMMGFYLLGKIKLPHDSDLDRIGVPRLMLSIVTLTFGLYLSGGLFGQQLHGLIDSYLPPIVDSSRENIVISPSEESLIWVDNLADGLTIAKAEQKPIFVDFTGYTCTNCRWMEMNVFEDIRVVKKFEEFITVRLFTDGGDNYKENRQMEVDRFGTAALPFYVILSPDNKEITRFHGMDPNVNKFLEFLEKGTEQF